MPEQNLSAGFAGNYQDAIHKQPRHVPPLPPSEDPTPENTYALLAQELNKMSIQERDSIFDDIHGVAKFIDETPEFVHQSLLELQQEIDKIPQKSAYLQADGESTKFVQDKALRVKFLRAKRFVPKDAAEALVAFFQAKLELFGAHTLCREVGLQDFSTEDMELMMRGFFQLLPAPDRSGRWVVSQWPAVLNERDAPVKCKLRVMYYIVMMAVESEKSQQCGMVGLVYNVGSKPHIDRVGIWQGAKLLKALPARCNALHYCYNNPILTPIISLGMVAVGDELRARVRLHFGSHIECIYKLLTFGIEEEKLPIDTCKPELHLGKHWAWIEQRKKIDASQAPQREVKPAVSDVLFGRGKSFQNHPGNVWCRQLVESNICHYEVATKREKTALVQHTVQTIQSKSGRFMKFEINGWIQVEDGAARDKISHMFRSRRRKQPEEEEDVEMPDYEALVSDELGAPENSSRRVKKKSKKTAHLI